MHEEVVVPFQLPHPLVQQIHEVLHLSLVDPREEIRGGVTPVVPVAALRLGTLAIAGRELHVGRNPLDHAGEVQVGAVVAQVVLETEAHVRVHDPPDFVSQVPGDASQVSGPDVNVVVAAVRPDGGVVHDKRYLGCLAVAQRQLLDNVLAHAVKHLDCPGIAQLRSEALPASSGGRQVLHAEGGSARVHSDHVDHKEYHAQCSKSSHLANLALD